MTTIVLLLDRSRSKEAADVLKRMPSVNRNERDLLEAAVLKKRSYDLEGAHHLLTEAYALNPNNSKIIHELAQTKVGLARKLRQARHGQSGGRYNPQVEATRRRLYQESEGLLRKVIQLSDDKMRLAWSWHDLAWCLVNLRSPRHEVEEAFLNARTLAPYESRISASYEKWKSGFDRKRQDRK